MQTDRQMETETNKWTGRQAGRQAGMPAVDLFRSPYMHTTHNLAALSTTAAEYGKEQEWDPRHTHVHQSTVQYMYMYMYIHARHSQVGRAGVGDSNAFISE